jgi:hypothetical protein
VRYFGRNAAIAFSYFRFSPEHLDDKDCTLFTGRSALVCRILLKAAERAGSAAARSAGRCIRKFDGGSASRLPVARPPLTVIHGEDLDFVPAQPVNQGEGKSREDIPSRTASIAGPRPRLVGNRVDRVT